MEQRETRNVYAGRAPAHAVIQAGTIERLTVQAGSPGAAGPADPASGEERDPWVRAVAGSRVWDHVRDGADAGPHRERAAMAAERLAGLRDGAEAELSGDPWNDPGVAARFLERIEWLLPASAETAPLDLYPAEAALLVLTPFLYRTHYLRRVSELACVQPELLSRLDEPNRDRAAFEVFAEGDSALVQRALRVPESEGAVGWWLLHRWLVEDRELADPRTVGALLAGLGEPAAALGEALDVRRVTALLHGLRRGPDVCHPEFLGGLAADDRVRSGPGPQRMRDRRLALLTALAYAASAEMAALPGIVAEHLGIPDPVDLSELRATVEGARWGGTDELPVLRAECHHEAVVEALREHTARADELLHAIRRTVRERITEPMPPLPARLSSDGVTAAEGAFDGYARFRSDGRRVRDLVMGVELYKDRDLAIRELYQNALDACRYREARGAYLDRTDPVPGAAPYEGRIAFTQGVDDTGRAYVECRDNGIGMGEEELRGVFACAGARFAEQREFRLERAQWEALDPPITLHPNSRFGIGVLSYFMLADEIAVTTCRMAPDGAPGPRYQVSICGPGHLFRINRTAPRGREPGTHVRLYLRPDVDTADWSCVNVLERVLAIAEFATNAEDGRRTTEWTPGELRVREHHDTGVFGYSAYGDVLPWPETPGGAQVVWVEEGGALLVDGLYVRPTIGRGVLGRAAGDPELRHAVVNLRGAWSPARLSADRRDVLDDVRPVLADLLGRAAAVLTRGTAELPNVPWLCELAMSSHALGDLVARALSAAGVELSWSAVRFGTPRAGLLPLDFTLVRWDGRMRPPTPSLWSLAPPRVPPHIYLWRTLAHAQRDSLRELAELCPEITTFGPVDRAVPSDEALLGGDDRLFRSGPVLLSDVAERATVLQRDPRDVARRLTELGMPGVDPRDWSDDARLTMGNSRIFDFGNEEYGPSEASLSTGTPLSPRLLFRAAAFAHEDIATTVAHLRRFGFQVPEATFAFCRAAEDDELLWLTPGDRAVGCLEPGVPVPLGHLAQASATSGRGVSGIREDLAAHGLESAPGVLPEHPSRETLTLLSKDADGLWPWLEAGRSAPPGHILEAAGQLECAPGEVITRLQALGFPAPRPFPDDASADDLPLLHQMPLEPERFLRPEGPVSWKHVLKTSAGPEGVRRRVARLRAFGFPVPLRVPDRPTELDRALLGSDSAFPWQYLDTHSVVPFSYALVMAREVGTTPSAVARRLRSYGLETSHESLPKGLSFYEASKLLDPYDHNNGGVPHATEFSLQVLHDLARRRRTSITRIATWLQQLGIPVPDPAETVREALKRVPRAAQGVAEPR